MDEVEEERMLQLRRRLRQSGRVLLILFGFVACHSVHSDPRQSTKLNRTSTYRRGSKSFGGMLHVPKFLRRHVPKYLPWQSAFEMQTKFGRDRSQTPCSEISDEFQPPLESLDVDQIERLPYRVLQKYAKLANIKSKQKAEILRFKLSEYLLDAGKLPDQQSTECVDLNGKSSATSPNSHTYLESSEPELLSFAPSTVYMSESMSHGQGVLDDDKSSTDSMEEDESTAALAKQFNDALRACGKQGDIRGAERCLRAMESAGLAPAEKQYNKVLAACGRKGNFLEAQRFFEEMITRGVNASTKSYTAIIHAHTRARNLKGAEKCIKEMEGKGIMGDGVTYGSLIHALAKEGNFGRAQKWLNFAKSSNVTLNAFAYNGFIIACGRFRENEECLRWLDAMLLDNVIPDNYTFVAAALPFAREGDYETVFRLKERLFNKGKSKFLRGPKMDTHAYNCILLSIKAACPMPPLGVVEHILREMHENNVVGDGHTLKHIASIEKSLRYKGSDGSLLQLINLVDDGDQIR